MGAFSLVRKRTQSLLLGQHCLKDPGQWWYKKQFCHQVKKAISLLRVPSRPAKRRGEHLHPLLINYRLFSLPAYFPIRRKRTVRGRGLERGDPRSMLNSLQSFSSCRRATHPLAKTHPLDRSSPVSTLAFLRKEMTSQIYLKILGKNTVRPLSHLCRPPGTNWGCHSERRWTQKPGELMRRETSLWLMICYGKMKCPWIHKEINSLLSFHWSYQGAKRMWTRMLGVNV